MAPCDTAERGALLGRDVRGENEGVSRELGLERRDDPMTNLGSLGFPVEDLQRVRLDVRPGFEPSAKPPVRIFVGTEPAQYRPERILVWSIEQVRDPSRVYEITLMRELPGFDRRGWTTSFTNYRFLIPHLVGGEGRAIYNDEDQIYLSDPAELFDAQMHGHGVLAVLPQDTSVMLVDCARMTSVWPLAACYSESKKQLLARGREIPELFGSLGIEWNARDQEYREGQTRCLHYTTLHTQPWRPFPGALCLLRTPASRSLVRVGAERESSGLSAFHTRRSVALLRTDTRLAAAGAGGRPIREPENRHAGYACDGSCDSPADL